MFILVTEFGDFDFFCFFQYCLKKKIFLKNLLKMSPFQGFLNLIVHQNRLVDPLKSSFWSFAYEFDSESGLGKYEGSMFLTSSWSSKGI